MRFFVKQKILRFIRNEFDIADENGNFVYKVKSTLTIPYKLRFYNQENQIVFEVCKRYFRILSRYDIRQNKQTLAIIKSRISVLTNKFQIISENENINGIKVVGDIFGLSFDLTKTNDETVAVISKKYISIGDKYSIEILDEQNKDIYLAIAIVIDDIIHKSKKRKRIQ